VRAQADGFLLEEPDQQREWSVLLTLDLPLFDSGLIRARVDERRERTRVSELNLAAVRRRAGSEVRAAFIEFLAAAAQRARLGEAVAAARENHRVQEEDYQLGRASQLDALTALAQWHRLQRREAEAEIGARASLVRPARGRRGGRAVTLSDLAIKRPVFAWMLMTALIVFGSISIGRLGVSMMPDVDFPVLEIRVTWEGAAPEILEAELVDQIEQKVIAVEGIKETRSSVRQGQASIELEFELKRDIDAAVQEVQAALSQIRLPLGVEPPVIRKNSTESDPIMWLGLSGPQSLRELINFVDDLPAGPDPGDPRRGRGIPGRVHADRNLRLWVDSGKLKQYELTVLDLASGALSASMSRWPRATSTTRSKEMNVRTHGRGVDAGGGGGDLVISHRGGQPDLRIYRSGCGTWPGWRMG
jgi:hypothetical protein